jgi:Glu-tRNA(Gln) amidotransferase subunit E-like FAD-binding protein
MSNVFTTIGHDVKVAAVDTARVVVKVVEFLPKAEKIIASAVKDQPILKQAIIDLVKQASAVVGDVSLDVAQKGMNLMQDAKTLADAEAFFLYFKSKFVPLVESVYKEVEADLQ